MILGIIGTKDMTFASSMIADSFGAFFFTSVFVLIQTRHLTNEKKNV